MSSSDGQKIVTPESIVADYKASGQFDKLKADLQSQFMSDEFVGVLRSQIENIVRTRVQSDEMLTYMPQAHALLDLQQNINRDGVVDRFIGEEFLSKVLNEEAVSAKINAALQELIKPKVEAFKANFEKDFQAGMEAGLASGANAKVVPEADSKVQAPSEPLAETATEEKAPDSEAMEVDPKPPTPNAVGTAENPEPTKTPEAPVTSPSSSKPEKLDASKIPSLNS
ncbi:hypothetical protein BKA70DRAFT_1258274 [Coprinopsis sp. MPI-PUGE-AT-0042]|nr:hypothetical protein BKA70DRAFT_1258274 [Coprinopsis sp. MPI-PUGE-AT-0042]